MTTISVFAPATVANLACGFDVLGLAIDNLGDSVTVSPRADSEVVIESIEGDGGQLSLDPQKNTAGVAVLALKKTQNLKQGFNIKLCKGLPLGSGLGSSAASSVAALVAVNELLEKKLSREELLPFALESERVACGSAHADNVAPALLGGIVLIRGYQPLDTVKLSYPDDLQVVICTPKIELKTSDARRVLRKQIRLADAITQWGNLAGLVAGLLKNDLALVSRSLQDHLIEPERAILIPGFYKAKQAALDAGALGCSISGAGPSIFALTSNQTIAIKVSQAIKAVFDSIGIEAVSSYSKINSVGARVL